jgi:hypothetical protein
MTGVRPAWPTLAMTIALGAALAMVACGGGSPSSGETGQGSKSAPSAEIEVERAGREADEKTAAAIVAVQRGYLEALARRDYIKACSLLSRPTLAGLESSVVQAGRSGGCPAILPHVLGGAAAAMARQQSKGGVRKVRLMHDQAFVIFHAPGARLFVFGLVREQDGWAATTLTSTVLAPSQATLGGA